VTADKRVAVRVDAITPGPFSGERVWAVASADGGEPIVGIAPTAWCHDGNLVNATAIEGDAPEGFVDVSLPVGQGCCDVYRVPADRVVPRPGSAGALSAEVARLRAENDRLRDLLDRAGETLSIARGACQDASLQPGDRYGTAVARIDRLFDEFSASPDKRRGPLRVGGGGRW
jgi:hypothetical protein